MVVPTGWFQIITSKMVVSPNIHLQMVGWKWGSRVSLTEPKITWKKAQQSFKTKFHRRCLSRSLTICNMIHDCLGIGWDDKMFCCLAFDPLHRSWILNQNHWVWMICKLHPRKMNGWNLWMHPWKRKIMWTQPSWLQVRFVNLPGSRLNQLNWNTCL